MTIDNGPLYASLIVRLLLDGNLGVVETRGIRWGDLLHIAAQNGVLIRVVDQLEKIGIEPLHFFSVEAKVTRIHSQEKLAMISLIGQRCSEIDVPFIFAKTIQNYPDLTGDIDLYITPQSVDVDAVILKGIPNLARRRTMRNRIDGSANYQIAGCQSVLEIHHGRVGMVGEHGSYISQMIRNGRYVTVADADFLTTSPEDQLVLQGMQRVVQRSYLRLSDVVATFALLRRESLDWNYIVKTAKDLNIFFGLRCYLGFAEQIYQKIFKTNLLSASLRKLLRNSKSIEFRDGFYRFPRISLASVSYADKFCSALRSHDWPVASRLSLLPFLALTTFTQRVRISSGLKEVINDV